MLGNSKKHDFFENDAWALKEALKIAFLKFVMRDFQSLRIFFGRLQKLNGDNLLCSETSKELSARYFVTVRHLDRTICLENDILVIFPILKHEKV